jgi:hypothetical protein
VPATALPPAVQSNPLRSRLARLRRRLRFVVTTRGLSLFVAVLLATALLGGLLDWRFHLPSLVRAVLLVGGLAGAGCIAYRFLFVPLSQRADDLSLALRVEEQYPGLNDALASTIEFLQQPDDSEKLGSPGLRREAVRRAVRRAEGCDFNRVIDSRGLRRSAAFLGVTALFAGAVILINPALAWTAVARLAIPFGTVEWPRQTQLAIEPPRPQIGRNEPFEVRALVRGVLPEKGSVVFRFEGPSQVEQVCEITRTAGEPFGRLVAQLKPVLVQRSFTLQVRANDAVSETFAVTVLPPPVLVPRGGKASPLIHVDYPPYTDQPAQDLPDGNGNLEVVAGSVVSLQAAADRPLAGAWIEYQPDPKYADLSAFLGPLGQRQPVVAASLAAAGQSVWDRVPAALEDDHRLFHVRFLPRVSGAYVLHFEDETGLSNNRLFELRVQPDPAPTVNLERPSASRDNLELLPGAEVTLQVSAADPQYAVRSAYLEYRCKKGDPPRRLLLYDYRIAGTGVSQTLAALALSPLPPGPARLRLPQVDIHRRLSLKLFKHLAGGELKEGDVVTLQAVADDFDDVAVDKQPGRSHEVEIRIISRNALDILLNKEQAKVQEELVLLRQQQRDALKKVTDAETKWKRTGQLPPEELDQLHQAEQLQEQIRERVGTTKEEALRGRVERILEALRDNQVPRSATQERMEAVESELNRLAREELEQIEQRLTNVRKQQEAGDKPEGSKKEQERLTEARRHQEEVEKTLNDLLSRLEPWTSTREIKGEARSILQEQKELNRQTEEMLQDPKLRDNKLENLSPQQRTELDKAEQAQQKLEERTAQLLDKMNRVSQERKDKDPDTAKELERAHELGTQENITGQMQDARKALSQDQLNQANKGQKEVVQKLEKLIKELEDRREAELDRLVKKLREAEQRLDELAQKQEELQKKVKEAAGIADAQKREEELKKLAREQKKLNQEAQEMVRQLSRLRAERASQALGKAGGQMDQAGQQLAQGQNAEEQQEDVLDRIDEAQRELERAREQAEEELAREQLAKIADVLKRLKEREEGLVAELGRIQQEVQQRKGWGRGLLFSLGDLQRAQKALGTETTEVARKDLSEAPVFRNLLRRAAKAMDQAADRMQEHQQQASKKPDDTAPDEEAAALQKEALHRLEQLLEALKQEPGDGQRQPGGGGKPGGGGSGAGGGGGDGIPEVAQLKLLRTLQAEVNQRTEDFAQKHPDLKKLDDKAKAELQSIRRDQAEVGELLEELNHPPAPEGDKP